MRGIDKESYLGVRFNRLEIFDWAKSEQGSNLAVCRCDCGNIVKVQPFKLRAGHTKSCGCLSRENLRSRNYKRKGPKEDLTGQRFGRLVVLSQTERKYGPIRWLCSCDCGNETTAERGSLRTGHKKSCGCLGAENLKTLSKTKTHGLSKTKEYHIWEKMISRCHSVTSNSYHKYGARGITVCQEWREHPELFINWYRENLDPSIYIPEVDRINNDLGYSPDNCRIVSRRENNWNKRTSFMIEVDGAQVPAIRYWSEFPGEKSNYMTFYERMKTGRSLEEALNPQKLQRRKSQT